MGFLTLIILALGMAMDAFAAALARGATLPNRQLRLPCLLRTALIFGAVETAMPLLGFTLGRAAEGFIQEWDHWLAFVLLMLLGGKMVYESCFVADAPENEATMHNAPQGRLMLVAVAFATSIDSLIVGVGLAFLEVNIWLAALMIGTASTIMAALGLHLGRFFGAQLGKRAEAIGGILLMCIGCWVLATHLDWV